MQRHRVRADPVSCQTCRSKKLKCNRVQPCSNCSARGIACKFLVPPQGPANTTSSFYSSAEILGRIERLESIVLKRADSTENRLKDALDHNGAASQQPRYSGSEIADVHQKRDQDLQSLENIGTREDSLLPRLPNGLVFKIRSTNEIIETQTCLRQSTLVFGNGQLNDIIVIIPDYNTATLLFQSYESNVDVMCRILHIPTLRSLIKTFYLRINENKPVLPGQAALLISVFAIGAYFYQPFDKSEVVTTTKHAIHLSKIFSKGALDALGHSLRHTSGTLEDVQASLLMSFVAYHLHGFSAKGRLLFAAAVSVARELRLHRLDTDNEPSTAENETNIRALINREIKRRVFWHIASTDWILSTVSGPQEGTYLIHPNHVNVKLPKDCSDDDLILGEEDKLIVTSQPTDMTFFLERLRLAHLCREMTDTVPLETSRLIQMPYEQIISLDKKLQNIISNAPFFFKLDAESRERSKPLETIYPKIPVLRYCIATEAHSKRCKLHQKFLHRQSIDPRYAYSRTACLESARAVVQVYRDLREYVSLSIVTERMGMAVHFTHLALVVMAMDLCFNKGEADQAEIKAEVKATLQMFEDANNISPLLSRFLSSLRDVLAKHSIQLTDPLTLTNNNFAEFPNEPMLDAFNNDLMQFTPGELEMQDPAFALNTSFDEFWQIAMQDEPNPDSLTWDNLFSALDSRPL